MAEQANAERSSRAAPARADRRRRRKLSLRSGAQEIEVIEIWSDGFAILRDGPHPRRGVVDLFEGGRHISRGLAYPTCDDHDRSLYAFKISQRAGAEQPRDYAAARAELPPPRT